MRLDDMDGSGTGGGDRQTDARRARARLGWLGLGAVVALGISVALGVNPRQLLGLDDAPPVPQMAPSKAVSDRGCQGDLARPYPCKIFAAANGTWAKAFPKGQYQPPKIVFYAPQGQSGCATAPAAIGPFYCADDQGIYLDIAVLDALALQKGSGGEAAMAYMVAHEIGHHIQSLTGIEDQVRRYLARASQADDAQLREAMELQADCYVGVWVAQSKAGVGVPDMGQGLRSVHQMARKMAQQKAPGQSGPDNFSHGALEDRMAWLKRGLETGDPDRCDPFRTVRLSQPLQ